MSEDWRRAQDKSLVVGIVFVDFRKAFDSISHHVLLNKFQALVLLAICGADLKIT